LVGGAGRGIFGEYDSIFNTEVYPVPPRVTLRTYRPVDLGPRAQYPYPVQLEPRNAARLILSRAIQNSLTETRLNPMMSQLKVK
jgi:hypothetical protein